MVYKTWESMGCAGFTSERACNEALGLDKLQSKYEKHWFVTALFSLRRLRK